MDHVRQIDRWLRWAAILGPFLGFMFGILSGSMIAYQAFKNQDNRIVSIEGWKEKQDAFNEKTVVAITRLKVIVKDLQP